MLQIIKKRADWVCHLWRRDCLVVKGKVEGRIEVMGRGGRRRKQLLETLRGRDGRGSTRSHCVEKSLWKRLWIRVSGIPGAITLTGEHGSTARKNCTGRTLFTANSTSTCAYPVRG